MCIRDSCYTIYDPATMNGEGLPAGRLAAGTCIDSAAHGAGQEDLVGAAFQILSQTPDLNEAVNALQAMVGSRQGAEPHTKSGPEREERP